MYYVQNNPLKCHKFWTFIQLWHYRNRQWGGGAFHDWQEDDENVLGLFSAVDSVLTEI